MVGLWRWMSLCVCVCVCVCVYPHECACLSFSFFAHLSKAGRLAVFQDGVRLPHQPFHPPHPYSQVRCSCFPGVWLQQLEWSSNSTESNIAGLICFLLWQGLRNWNGALIFGSSTALKDRDLLIKSSPSLGCESLRDLEPILLLSVSTAPSVRDSRPEGLCPQVVVHSLTETLKW